MLALPIFPGSHPPSIVGAYELNFCVRDGNRWTLIAINTNYLVQEVSLRLDYDSTAYRVCQQLFLQILKNFASNSVNTKAKENHTKLVWFCF